jgi:DNA replication and repair protein RecF
VGESIHRAREAYVERLMPVAADLARFLVGGELSVTYRPGWAIESSLADALSKSWTYDQERGSTTVGPHRSELSVRFNGAPAKDRVSRGQQKLLAAALLLAQLTNFPRSEASIPTLLLDDPAAELDSDRLFKLISAIADQALQLIVTSLTDDFRAFGVPGRRYRLSSGTVVQT